MLARLPDDVTAAAAAPVASAVKALNEALLRRGVIVRPVGNYDLPHSVRISVGTEAENARLLAALDDTLPALRRATREASHV